MDRILGNPIEQVTDGENNPVEFDFAYPVKADVVTAINQLKQLHGGDIYLVPMSGTSTGGGIFQPARKPSGTVVGLRFDPPLGPRVSRASRPGITDIGLDEIVIDTEHQQVSAGSAITLDQLNRVLVQELGQGFKVPGADLTSYLYAAVGATFMTGGMGPQRRYFSDSVIEIALFDGSTIVSIQGDELRGYAGTYGWSGIVCAVRCNYCRFPANEVAFALPVSNRPADLARLLEHLSPHVFLDLDSEPVKSRTGNHDLILGIEHVSRGSMQPLLSSATDHPARKRAEVMQQKCVAAGATGLVFVNGYSERPADEFLISLADDPQAQEYTIAGIGLEYAEIFTEPEEMRALREAIPYTARTQVPSGRMVYKNHSDANIRVSAHAVAAVVEQLWEINRDYIARVEDYFDGNREIDGQILVYGHLNPYGLDPHNRVTMSSNSESAFRQARDFLIEQRAQFYRALSALCKDDSAVFVGGEKAADSELGIYLALGGPENAPAALFNRFKQQQATIRRAAKIFNWRAPPPYG
ncbi:MAG: hypothetical protein OES20_06890 [Gammaproteobacteria bacterium]|nr:hypothetical protein [Gammaproteobacteria bacterium]